MRSVLATFATAVVLVVGTSGIALATGAMHEFSGKITHVNTTTRTLAVKQTAMPNTVMSFALAPDAKIVSDAMPTSLDKLTVGQRVAVKYSDDGAKHEAHRVEAHTKTASAKPYSKPTTKN